MKIFSQPNENTQHHTTPLNPHPPPSLLLHHTDHTNHIPTTSRPITPHHITPHHTTPHNTIPHHTTLITPSLSPHNTNHTTQPPTTHSMILLPASTSDFRCTSTHASTTLLTDIPHLRPSFIHTHLKIFRSFL